MTGRSSCVFLITLLLIMKGFAAAADEEPPYEGRKKCGGCHKSQYKFWRDTTHATAVESLAPGVKAEEKDNAGLDPDKDYSEDEDCVGCHVTGFGKEGGYDMDDPSKYLVGVTCESCHGAGSEYRLIHRKAPDRFEKTKETTSRQVLAGAGQEFSFVERCNACHLNYEGSPWVGVKKPYTPFTPKVDPKYAFDFEKRVRDFTKPASEPKGMHQHFKLEGVFAGEPKPPFHDEFQAEAKEKVE